MGGAVAMRQFLFLWYAKYGINPASERLIVGIYRLMQRTTLDIDK